MTHMRRAIAALVVVAVVVAVLLVPDRGSAATTRWTVDGYTIQVNGQPFFAKGVCYFPLPLGNQSSRPPYGDYFYNFPGDPPVWKPYLDRDLPRMRAAGVNLIRLYSMWAWAAEDYVVSPLNGNKARTLGHGAFMDTAYNGGTHPMYVLVNVFIEAGRWSDRAYQLQIEDVYRQLATELKDHPAVMGFMVGNELNAETTRGNPRFWQWIDDLAGIVKAIAPDKLTTMALVDDGLLSIDAANQVAPRSGSAVMPHLDVWGINNYRGTMQSGFGDDFWSSYRAKTSKPILLTEWGAPASTHVPDAGYAAGGVPVELPNRAQDQATYIRNHYNDMVDHSTLNAGVSSGGALFMWADQWDKQECPTCSPLAQDGTNGTGGFPGKWWDEEWFGIHAIAKDPGRPHAENWNVAAGRPHPADTLVPRAAYDTIATLFTVPDPEVRVTRGTVAAVRAGAGAAASEESAPDTVDITLSLLSNQLEGFMADFYVGAVVFPHRGANSFTIYHLAPDLSWSVAPPGDLGLPGTPAHSGPLTSLATVELHSGPVAPGYYIIFFGVTVDRGQGGGQEMYLDIGEVEVPGR